ncbi:dienelactone hydrolase family protein [Chlamydia ibidis]|uniref:Dienelactone hydrolase family protein n=2 Tax=Chlamydia ibidis TaxID=1405396 RepID=S7KH92_9CHLA|nr:alpha/beta hydrolase [Chlamydia ibidis]EPP35551.1 dienelactone hydrolase family protein [Chlamydia ibidis]EQM62673.1 prolyl oligopeptidase family protein [Chlamydia ibidis 10-1398/6]
MEAVCSKHERRTILKINTLNNITTFGVLHTPLTRSSSYPLVIILHGLASDKVGSLRSHVRISEMLTKQGIASLRVDLPGHGDSEGQLFDFAFDQYTSSVLDIINYAYNLPNIDTGKIGIFGSSLGGTLALLNMPALPYIKALAVWAPTIRGSLWLQENANTANSRISQNTATEQIFYSGIPLNKTFCSQFIEMDIIKEIKLFSQSLSILYMQGLNDPVVSVQHQKIFSDAMKARRLLLDIHNYSEIGHSFAQFPTVFSDLISWITHQLNV